MKRTIIAILIVLLVCSSVFADSEPAVRYEDKINFAFAPSLSRYDAMGQSGIANTTRLDSFFSNPSVIGLKNGFAISITNISASFYNLQKMVSDPEAMEDFNALIKGDTDAAVPFATKYLENLGTGRNMIAKFDLGFGIEAGVIGLGTNVQVRLHALNEGTSVASQSIIPEVNIAETLALGIKIINTDAFSLSAGVSVHGVYKVYFKGIGGNKILEMIGGSSDADKVLLWDTPVMAGLAAPVDAGVTFGFFDDQLTLAATANNLNGTYHMKSYSGAGYLVNSLSKDAIPVPSDVPPAKDSVSFDVATPWTLNFGVAFAPEISVIQPTLTADLIDMLSIINSIREKNFRASDLLLHLNLGAELGLLNIVKARVGINRGYLSIGAGVWLPFAQVDVSYGWQEFGTEIGDKPVDSVTVKFSLGYDK